MRANEKRMRKGRLITIRMEAEQERRLKAIAASQHLNVSQFVRAFVDMVANDPRGFAVAVGAIMREDLGGPVVTVRREVIDQAEAEAKGQLRLVT